ATNTARRSRGARPAKVSLQRWPSVAVGWGREVERVGVRLMASRLFRGEAHFAAFCLNAPAIALQGVFQCRPLGVGGGASVEMGALTVVADLLHQQGLLSADQRQCADHGFEV